MGDFGAGNFTVSAWMKLTGPVTGRSTTLFHHYASYGAGLASVWLGLEYNTGRPNFDVRDSAGNYYRVFAPALADGDWHQLVGVREGQVLRLYTDGVLATTLNAPGLGNCTDQGLRPISYVRLGGTYTSYNHWTTFHPPEALLNGLLDEVMVHGQALSAAEVEQNHAATLAGLPAWNHVIALWPFDETTGTTVAEATGHASGFHNGVQLGTPGVRGNGYSFDGVNDAVIADNGLGNFGEQDFSLTLWLRTEVNTNQVWGNLFHHYASRAGGRQAAVGLGLNQVTNQLDVQVRDVSGNEVRFVDGASLSMHEWHHVALVRQGTSMLLYVDGDLHGTGSTPSLGTVTDEWVLPSAYVRIGGAHTNNFHWSEPWAVDSYFRGQLDEMKLFARALSPSDVRDDMEDIRPIVVPRVTILAPASGAVLGTATVPVTAQIIHAAATTVSSLPAGVSASLAGDGQVSGVVTLTAEGPSLISVNAVDSFGKVGANSVEVILDTVAPLADALAPAANAIVSTPVVSVAVRVTDTTATTVRIGAVSATLLAGGGDASLTVPLVEGLNSLAVQVTDAAGHQTNFQHPVWRDSSVPLLTIDTPANGTVFGVGESVLFVQATVDDASPTTVTSTPAGVSASLPSGGGIASGNVTLGEGSTTITVHVADGLNAISSQSVTVVLDTTGPDTEIASPGTGSFLAGIVDFDVTATDPAPGSGVTEVRFFVDNTLLTTRTAAPYEFDLDTALLVDGSYLLRAIATDGKGNSTSVSIPVVVDNTAPVLTLVAPISNATVQGTFPIQLDVRDATAGLVQVTMTAGGLAPSTGGSATYPTPIANVQIAGSEDSLRWPDGPLQLRATARDASGNETSLAWTVQVGNSVVPPTCMLNVLDQTTVSGAVMLRATATGSFANITLAVDGVVIASGSVSPLEVDFDTLARFDGPMLVQATVTQANQQTVGCAVTLHVDNLAVVDFAPQTLNLDSGSADNDRPVDALVEGLNVASMLPLASHSVLLLLPGGSPVTLDPATPAQNPGDDNGNSIPDVTLRFVRSALVASLRAGIANGGIVLDNRKADVPITVVVDGRVLGSTSMKIITKRVR
ncbi:MAG: hypothetical protein IPM13_19760 [Phycisphaerales bacterium]|nr:hypothetical protein [Phycisphaerales bacterium]